MWIGQPQRNERQTRRPARNPRAGSSITSWAARHVCRKNGLAGGAGGFFFSPVVLPFPFFALGVSCGSFLSFFRSFFLSFPAGLRRCPLRRAAARSLSRSPCCVRALVAVRRWVCPGGRRPPLALARVVPLVLWRRFRRRVPLFWSRCAVCRPGVRLVRFPGCRGAPHRCVSSRVGGFRAGFRAAPAPRSCPAPLGASPLSGLLGRCPPCRLARWGSSPRVSPAVARPGRPGRARPRPCCWSAPPRGWRWVRSGVAPGFSGVAWWRAGRSSPWPRPRPARPFPRGLRALLRPGRPRARRGARRSACRFPAPPRRPRPSSPLFFSPPPWRVFFRRLAPC